MRNARKCTLHLHGADVAASDAAAFFREYSKLIRSFVSVVGLVRRSVVLDLPHAPVARLQAADLLGRLLSFLFYFKRRLKSPRILFDEAKTLRKAECARTTREAWAAWAMKRLRKAYPSVPEDADLYPDEALIVLHDSRPGLAPAAVLLVRKSRTLELGMGS